MVWAKPKYIVEDIDRYGNVRVYFRRRGQRKIRIHALPESPEFWEAHAAATQGRPLPPRREESRVSPRAREGTLRWLAQAYFSSPDFRCLDPSTQTVRRRVIEGCLLESLEPGSSFIMADCLDRISGKHVKMLRDRKAKVP
jgi:hypothetical protein